MHDTHITVFNLLYKAVRSTQTYDKEVRSTQEEGGTFIHVYAGIMF